MGFIRKQPKDPILSEDVNEIQKAWEGVPGYGVPLSVTEIDDATKYAGDFRQKDSTQGLIARFRNWLDESVLLVLKDALHVGKPIVMADTMTVDGIDVSEHRHTGAAGDAPQIGTAGLEDGAVTAAKVAADVATQAELDAETAARENADTGHAAATSGVHGVGASTVESAAGAQAKVDAHAALTSPHSATSSATANRLMLRDSNGRSKVAAPSASDDIARKDTVDAVSSALNTHKSSGDHDGRYFTETEADARFAPIAKGVTNGNSHDHAGGDGAQIGTAGMQPDSVDDTIVGNRVPQFYRRQGGSDTDWTMGGINNFIPGAVRIQVGVVSHRSYSPDSTFAVTFPVPFGGTPLVKVWLLNAASKDYPHTFFPWNETETGFDVGYSSDASYTGEVAWLAIGPE